MPISADCPQCGKTYRVKDDFAGKKFRCKACQAVVSVPEAKAPSGDPWDDLDLGEFQEQDSYADDEFAAPPATPQRRKKKKKSRSRAGGMPVTVIIALCGIGLLMAFNLFGIVAQAVQGAVPGACGSCIRLLIEIAVLVGLINRSAATRWVAIILSGIMALFLGLGVIGVAFFLSQVELPPQAEVPEFMIPLLIVILSVQIVIEFVIIGTLLAPSSADYLNQ
jgi:hypothetical protein